MRNLAIAAALTTLVSSAAWAQVPTLMPVQGFLTDGADVPIDETVSIVFTQWSEEVGGVELLQETANVDVVSGLFTIYLTVDPMILEQGVWLGVNVANDGEMPRVQLGTSPYAAVAELCGDAITLQGFDPSEFALVNHAHDFGDLGNIPADLADGDADTTYAGGQGIIIDGANTISLDTNVVQAEARAVAYDNEGELLTDLNDDFAALNHNHVPPAPTLDCQQIIANVGLISGGTSNINATCPAGFVLTGGGYNVLAPVTVSSVRPYRMYPDFGNNRYSCVVNYGTGPNTTMECRAICCRVQ